MTEKKFEDLHPIFV